jgi:4a-hydroxytetrahydrobiopterin dehydratase
MTFIAILVVEEEKEFLPHPKREEKRITDASEILLMQEDYRELSKQEIKMPGWEISDGKLHKSFEFENFAEAFAFMTRVAIEAEKLNHHPEWSNVYNHVSINLVTHDIGNKVSNYDIMLAQKISKIHS